jgi:thiamine biosynthesis lipoprotein
MWLILTDFKKYFSFLFLASFCSCQTSPIEVNKIEGFALGTTYSIILKEVPDVNKFELSLDSIFRVLNKSLSTYVPNSDISKINRGDSLQEVDIHFINVYNAATEVWRKSDGYFDPTVGALVNAYGFGPGKALKKISKQQRDSILMFTGWDKTILTDKKTIHKDHPSLYFDFNALAKGYAVDVIANFIKFKGGLDFLIEVGGEIMANGKSPKTNELWKVAIDDPQQGEKRRFAKVISLDDQALATSGNYRKHKINKKTGQLLSHSINPKTGNAFPSMVLSASVLAPNCMIADAYATSLMVMPFNLGKAMIENDPNLEAFWIIKNEKGIVQEFSSNGFSKE